ncbi:MAG: SIR2 family NAD-dependent protein deacylase [Bacteroidia bacterium]
MKKNLVILSGAGISAESGIKTFRDSGGLWEGHDVTKVASPQGWKADPAMVLDFYNQRRKNVRDAHPNKAHLFLAELENYFNVSIITQNIDDLHERAGSTKIIHLHGEILKAQSSINQDLIYEIKEKDIHIGDLCELGSQLRPFIVWFGEPVPKLELAALEVMKADIFLIIGTSLQVYPAAGLTQYVQSACNKIIIDPNANDLHIPGDFTSISKTAENSIPQLKQLLL